MFRVTLSVEFGSRNRIRYQRRMGWLSYQRTVWWRAWNDAWRAVMKHSAKTLARDGAFLFFLIVFAVFGQRYLVERGIMSGDNVKDSFVWIGLTILSALTVFALWFFVEGLFVVPYKMWKEATEAPKAPAAAENTKFPDWRIHELFAYLRPDLTPKPEKAWLPTLNDVEDRFSTGQLDVWGRQERDGRPSLEKIDPSYWKDADLMQWAADPEWHFGRHTQRRSLKTEWQYRSLHVNKAQCLAIWPKPLAEPRPVVRDKRLKEALIYWIAQQWDGESLWEASQQNINLIGLALKWFHQLAADREIQVWGKRFPNHGPHEKILAEHWHQFHVDLTSLLSDTGPETSTIDPHDPSDEPFYDPMVSSVEVEKALHSINLRGGLYSIQSPGSTPA